MVKRFFQAICNPFRSRFIACTVLGLYTFALVAMPALDGLLHAHLAEPRIECVDPDSHSQLPIPTETCPICELVRLVVPFFTVDMPLLLRTDIGSNVVFTVLIPPITDAIVLPPCRAPPVLL